MKKLLKYLSCSIVFALVGCNKDKDLGFLGDIEVGKYEIVQYREYPNGIKDTLIYHGYGPYYQQIDNRYYFDVNVMSEFYQSWGLKEYSLVYLNYNTNVDSMRYYNSSISELSNSEIVIFYTYKVNTSGTVSDSASGVITFKREKL